MPKNRQPGQLEDGSLLRDEKIRLQETVMIDWGGRRKRTRRTMNSYLALTSSSLQSFSLPFKSSWHFLLFFLCCCFRRNDTVLMDLVWVGVVVVVGGWAPGTGGHVTSMPRRNNHIHQGTYVSQY